MTDEIIKLYENAGVTKDCCKYAEYGYEGEEGTWYYCKKKDRVCWTYPNGDADCVEKEYPPFTAEKQIELIILLANREIRISPTYISSGYYLNDLNKIKSSRNISTFENSLAQHINAIWQDLTEEECKQIKEILE